MRYNDTVDGNNHYAPNCVSVGVLAGRSASVESANFIVHRWILGYGFEQRKKYFPVNLYLILSYMYKIGAAKLRLNERVSEGRRGSYSLGRCR